MPNDTIKRIRSDLNAPIAAFENFLTKGKLPKDGVMAMDKIKNAIDQSTHTFDAINIYTFNAMPARTQDELNSLIAITEAEKFTKDN